MFYVAALAAIMLPLVVPLTRDHLIRQAVNDAARPSEREDMDPGMSLIAIVLGLVLGPFLIWDGYRIALNVLTGGPPMFTGLYGDLSVPLYTSAVQAWAWVVFSVGMGLAAFWNGGRGILGLVRALRVAKP